MTDIPWMEWYQRWVAAAQVPYFVWVSTATVLQFSITWMHRG